MKLYQKLNFIKEPFTVFLQNFDINMIEEVICSKYNKSVKNSRQLWKGK